MITVTETVDIQAPAVGVFAYVDDIRHVGWHMTERSSIAMMGSRLELEILSEQPTGLGATYRCSGTMMGLSIELPRSGFGRIVGLMLARAYSRWCLRQMCRDTRRALERSAMART